MAAEVGTRAGLHDRATRPKLQAGTQQGTYESVCSSVEVGTVGGWWGMSRKVDRKLPPLPKGFRLSQKATDKANTPDGDNRRVIEQPRPSLGASITKGDNKVKQSQDSRPHPTLKLAHIPK